MSNHDLKAWYALLDLLSYMYKTRSKGITFGGDIKAPAVGSAAGGESATASIMAVTMSE